MTAASALPPQLPSCPPSSMAPPVPALCQLAATELVDLLRRRVVSPVEVLDAYLERLFAVNRRINAMVSHRAERAREEAVSLGDAMASGVPCPPLAGLPVLVKDLFDFVPGLPNTFGSVPFARFMPDRPSAAVARLTAAGAIVVGKTNVSEFGHLATTDNRLTGPTSCPFDLAANAGGSSGGSAAAVAAGMAPLATGSDGAGSIRVPAALCGVVGLKPTFGRVPSTSRPNGFRGAAPLVQSGPLARSVADAGLLLSVLAGPHPRDPLSLPDDGFDALRIPAATGVRIAYCPTLGGFPVEAEVVDVVGRAAAGLASACGLVEQVELRLPAPPPELAAVVRRWMAASIDDAFEGFRQAGVEAATGHLDALSESLRDLLHGAGEQTVRAAKADDQLRTGVHDAFEDLFEHFDAIVSPTTAVAGVPNATEGVTVGPREVAGRPVDPLIGWALTFPANMTGHPAASVPAGRTAGGRPVGLQIIGRRFEDATVLAVARAVEEASPWRHWYREVP